MRLSALHRLAWRSLVPAARCAGKRKSSWVCKRLSPAAACSQLPSHRSIYGTWSCLKKQQVVPGGGSGGAQDSATREVIESSRKALHLLQKEHPTFKPTLSIVQVGNDELGQEVRNVAEEIGLNMIHVCLPCDYTENEVVEEISKINEDAKIHGLLLRLDKELYTSKILNAVKPEKDVNGVTDFNLARLVHGDMHECVVPPIANAVVKLLEKQACATLDGKKVLLLGVQGPLEASLQCLLQRKKVVTMSCSWETKTLQTMFLDADMVVVGNAKPKEIPVTWMKPKKTTVDCSHDILWGKTDEQLERHNDQTPGEAISQLAVAMCMQNLIKISEQWIKAQQYKNWNFRCLKLHPLSPVPSDIEISRAQSPKAVDVLAREIGLLTDEIEIYGQTKAKVRLSLLERLKDQPDGKYVLVAG